METRADWRMVSPVEVRTTSWASVSLTRGSSTGPGLVTVGVEVRPRPRVREVRDNVVILMPDLHAQTVDQVDPSLQQAVEVMFGDKDVRKHQGLAATSVARGSTRGRPQVFNMESPRLENSPGPASSSAATTTSWAAAPSSQR